MTISTIDAYTGVIPDRNNQSDEEFTAAVITWLNYQLTLVTQTNTTVNETNTATSDVTTSQNAAAASAVSSSSFADSSQASAELAAATANFSGVWSSLTGSLNKPASVLHDNIYWRLLNDLSDVTASEPSVTSDWVSIPQPKKVIPRTAAASLTAELPNELQDGSTFPLPLASAYLVNTVIEIEQPRAFKAFKPSVERSGSDLISYENGTDTSITFANPTSIKLTTDGVSVWRL